MVANYQSIYLLLLTIAVTVGDTAMKVKEGYHGLLLGGIWFQALVPFAQLEVIVALTRDGGKSLASKALRTPVAIWLGNISAALYLIHFPVKDWLVWGLHGGDSIADPDDCSKYVYNSGEWWYCYINWQKVNQERSLKLWAMPIMVVLSLAMGALIYYYFEEPIRVATKKNKDKAGAATTTTTTTTTTTASTTVTNPSKSDHRERQGSTELLLYEKQEAGQGVELRGLSSSGPIREEDIVIVN